MPNRFIGRFLYLGIKIKNIFSKYFNNHLVYYLVRNINKPFDIMSKFGLLIIVCVLYSCTEQIYTETIFLDTKNIERVELKGSNYDANILYDSVSTMTANMKLVKERIIDYRIKNNILTIIVNENNLSKERAYLTIRLNKLKEFGVKGQNSEFKIIDRNENVLYSYNGNWEWFEREIKF